MLAARFESVAAVLAAISSVHVIIPEMPGCCAGVVYPLMGGYIYIYIYIYSSLLSPDQRFEWGCHSHYLLFSDSGKSYLGLIAVAKLDAFLAARWSAVAAIT